MVPPLLYVMKRGVFLENDKEMKVAHSVAGTAGETEVSNEFLNSSSLSGKISVSGNF